MSSHPAGPSKAEALRIRALAAPTTARPRAAVRLLREVLDELPPRGEPDGDTTAVAALAHALLAEALSADDQPRAALEHTLQALGLADESGDQAARARARLALGQVCTIVGHLGEAERHYQAVLELQGAEAETLVRARMNLASILRALGRLDQAGDAFDALLPLVARVRPDLGASLLINAASCYHQVGRAPDGRRALDRARALLPGQERPDLEAWTDAIAAWVALADGQLAESLGLARDALAPGRAGANLRLRSSAARAMAEAARAAGDGQARDQALQWLGRVLEEAEAGPAHREAAELHESMATMHEERADLAAAVQHLRRARELEAELRGHDERMRGEQERLRLEVVRLAVEADAQRSRRDELAQANRALLAADAARGRLVRTLAHDLRGPLTNLLVTVDMLDPDRPEEALRVKELVSASVARMVAMLEAAMAPTEAAEHEDVDLVEVARATAASFSDLARRKGQQVVVSDGPPVRVHLDPVPLGRLLDNLVSNALKYGPPGGRVDVHVRASGRGAQVLVLDQGPGFPGIDPSAGLLFGHQLSSRASGGEPGWGLGLHAVYLLLAELGGILALGNRSEGGAMVRVTLPLAAGG